MDRQRTRVSKNLIEEARKESWAESAESLDTPRSWSTIVLTSFIRGIIILVADSSSAASMFAAMA